MGDASGADDEDVVGAERADVVGVDMNPGTNAHATADNGGDAGTSTTMGAAISAGATHGPNVREGFGVGAYPGDDAGEGTSADTLSSGDVASDGEVLAPGAESAGAHGNLGAPDAAPGRRASHFSGQSAACRSGHGIHDVYADSGDPAEPPSEHLLADASGELPPPAPDDGPSYGEPQQGDGLRAHRSWTGASRGPAAGTRTVADLLRARRAEFTPAQRRVAQALLGDYPAAGLQSVARLAEAAHVSAPTVVRLVAELGFSGYPQMQDALREELSARGIGPLQAYAPGAGEGGRLGPGGPGTARAAAPLVSRLAGLIGRAVDDSLHALNPAELDRALDLLADQRRAVVVTGGRFSWVLAAHLAGYLSLLRPNVRHVPPEPGARSRDLLDISRDTTAVVFDYRRYQRDTTAFGRDAARRGARVIVCTDPYLSPASSTADVLLTTVVDGPPPFITMAPAFALVEMLVAGVTERGGQRARHRLAQFEHLASGTLES